MHTSKRMTIAYLAMAAALLALFALNLFWGSIALSPADIAAALLGRRTNALAADILLQLRLPRAVMVVLLGAGHLNGRMKPCAAGSGVDLRDERHAGVHLARRWVYDKNMLHRFVPFSIGYLQSTDTNYCSFFAAKVQYLGGNWLTERLTSPSGRLSVAPTTD